MEPFKNKVRVIPEARIKQLYGSHLGFEGEPEEFNKERCIRETARAIAEKLYEFHKIERIPSKDGTILYKSFIEVIIPPTPEDHV